MKVLVTVASKHGATAEIGKVIQQTITAAGHQAHLNEPGKVTDLSPYDAVVLGSAVYAGNWRPSARKFATKHTDELHAMPLWVFSSGPLGPEEEVTDTYMGPVIDKHVEALDPVEHKVFSGKLEQSDLNLSERMIIRVVNAPYGDYRDKNEIVTWAKSIADYLTDME